MAASSEATEAIESTTGGGFLGQILGRYFDELFLVFRLVFAFLVALHGAQKAFLLWGFPAAHPLGALVDLAGWVEFLCAFLIGLGIFTRLGAGALCVTMIVAYFRVHASNGIWPHHLPAGRLRRERRRGCNPVVYHCGNHRGAGQPQVRHRTAGLQEGDLLGNGCCRELRLGPVSFSKVNHNREWGGVLSRPLW